MHLGKSIDDIHPAMRIVEDLGADSLDVVELMLVLGEEFNTDLDEGEAAKLGTVADVSAYVTELAADTDRHAGS
jgi:acyl carrier protein